ncbi:hypothetical protein AX14_003932 [Amanita brunnescens Koide BX004]|nr:hypothetical protein AX14_003932 [Amanita brunnescens Koide BX004]
MLPINGDYVTPTRMQGHASITYAHRAMMLLNGLVLLSLVPAAYACSGHRRSVPSLMSPSRPLQWGDVNIIHTTDTHGWLLGHQKSSFPEPNYSGDLGDFFSFVAHMKRFSRERDVDLLVVDTGDLHDGTGLSDGYPPGGVDGHESNEIFKQLPYDVLAIGNHELYQYANTLDMYQNFVPRYKGRYLSSNVNITVTDQSGIPVSVPVGSRYRKFHTAKGRRVTALGVLFHFTGNAPNTTVQPVEDMIKEDWFAKAIADEPDFFLLTGHMPVVGDKWPYVFNAIRAVHPYTPILIFGGHTHIRDCNQLDGRSMSLESGRYMETVGWMSVNFTTPNTRGNLSFSRRYLDANRVTYEYHTSQPDHAFDTPQGKRLTKGLHGLWDRFNLSYVYGTASQDFTLSRSPYPSHTSILTELIDKVIHIYFHFSPELTYIPGITLCSFLGQCPSQHIQCHHCQFGLAAFRHTVWRI